MVKIKNAMTKSVLTFKKIMKGHKDVIFLAVISKEKAHWTKLLKKQFSLN